MSSHPPPPPPAAKRVKISRSEEDKQHDNSAKMEVQDDQGQTMLQAEIARLKQEIATLEETCQQVMILLQPL